MPQQPVTPPAAVEQMYALWLWLDQRVHDFATQARHGLGRRIVDTALDALEALTQASYAPRAGPERRIALAAANNKLAFLRLLLRGARDRRFLSIDQHAFATDSLVAVGKAVGGWLRHAAEP